MKPPRSLGALLAGSIDYAGLFPPATLELEPALKNFASYVRSEGAWMLSTFVLPIAKFADAAWFAADFNEEYPLRISALGPKTSNEIDFAEELKKVAKGAHQLETIKSFRVEQLEMPLANESCRKIFEMIDALLRRSFWETPANVAEKTIALLAEGRASARPKLNVERDKNLGRAEARPSGNDVQSLGFKLRTGGVTADAFPNSGEIARALVAAAKNKVPIKFTAGLHHPVRMFREEVKTKMHGFLNVLGAGVLAIEHKWNEEQTIAMLDDEDASAFMFTDKAFRWRDSEIATERIIEHRNIVTSFGSCSFDDPRDDLRALKLL